MDSELIAISAVGIGLAGLILSLEDAIRALAERRAFVEGALPFPARIAPDAKQRFA